MRAWHRAAALTVFVLAAAPPRGAAQTSMGDSAWTRREYASAAAAYRRALAGDSLDPRANQRLGLMLAWDGHRDSAFVHLRRARQKDPGDLETRLTEARVLAWDGKIAAAIARYDSLLDEHPGHADAMVGRAQALAWRGDLRAAERQYLAVLDAEPRNSDAMVGLGYLDHWRKRERAARERAEQALAQDSTNAGARALRAAVHVATRPRLESSFTWSNDSDRNTAWGQVATASGPLVGRLRGTAAARAMELSDPVRNATSLGGEAGLVWAGERTEVAVGAGARRLSVGPAARTGASYRARASHRLARSLTLAGGYSRQPFDETAGLIERGLDLEVLDGGAQLVVLSGLTLQAGVEAAWVSDGNHRTSFTAALSQQVGRHVTLGLAGRSVGYDQAGIGYFSPDRFGVMEATAGYRLDSGSWTVAALGALGAQRVRRDASAQSQWHANLRLGRRWGAGNRVELFGLVTNSALSSTTGAFRSRALGLALGLGL